MRLSRVCVYGAVLWLVPVVSQCINTKPLLAKGNKTSAVPTRDSLDNKQPPSKKPDFRDTSITVRQSLPTPVTVEIDDWPGRVFVALEKPAIYCQYGYDLYACPLLDACRDPVDSTIFSKYRRARCDRFAAHRFRIVSVKPDKGERLLTLKDEQTGVTVYTRTKTGVFNEIAFESDCDSAKKRFLGKTVYSARGNITVFDKGKTFGIKVRLQDPLKVTDVRFGLAPLPTKPLWLMVQTPGGEKGTIPFFYSWTNVKKDLRRAEGNPWDDDVFETSPEKTRTISPAVWEVINSHSVREGMTRDEVRLSWGRPLSIKKVLHEGTDRECWTYQAQRLLFDDKELITILAAE